MSLPIIHGTARLTDDPELRYSANGMAICKVRLAFNNRRKNPQTQEWEDGDVCFLDGTVFKQEAENVAESLNRGYEVTVSGRLKTNQYETREGEKRSRLELLIDSIGPTLKFATAKVQKMSRGSREPGAAPAGGGPDDPWASAAPAGNGQRDPDDEPPF